MAKLVGGCNYGAGVKQVVKLRMLPSGAEAEALDETLRVCNAACSWLSEQMHATRGFRKIDAQHRFYSELRERFGLGAQATIRVIGKLAVRRPLFVLAFPRRHGARRNRFDLDGRRQIEEPPNHR